MPTISFRFQHHHECEWNAMSVSPCQDHLVHTLADWKRTTAQPELNRTGLGLFIKQSVIMLFGSNSFISLRCHFERRYYQLLKRDRTSVWQLTSSCLACLFVFCASVVLTFYEWDFDWLMECFLMLSRLTLNECRTEHGMLWHCMQNI